MIPVLLEAIDESTLRELIDNRVPESRTIDYKSALYGKSDKDRREFLADVSAFANGVGGDLVIGMKETDGLPTECAGIAVENIDAELQRLQSIIRSGLEPRLTGYDIHPIPLADGNHVIILRIRRSWNAPHRVVFDKYDKFGNYIHKCTRLF